MYKRLHVKYAFLCQILMKIELSRYSLENTAFYFINSRPVRAELLLAGGRAGGRKDNHGEANSRFPQFFERACKCVHIRISNKCR
jgi:hypothetical protein